MNQCCSQLQPARSYGSHLSCLLHTVCSQSAAHNAFLRRAPVISRELELEERIPTPTGCSEAQVQTAPVASGMLLLGSGMCGDSRTKSLSSLPP